MLLSMETVVEFKFSDEENQFYLLPVHVTSTSDETSSIQSTRITSAATSGRISSRIQHADDNSNQLIACTNSTADSSIPSLVEENDMLTMDHYGQVSVYLSQSREKPVKNFWNVCILIVKLACIISCGATTCVQPFWFAQCRLS